MKIAITGHTKGIGRGLAQAFQEQNHEIIGLSTSTGQNIRNIPKTADLIEPCDLFVNNAQAGYAQTELLFEICDRWASTNKRIIVISTMMTRQPVSVIEGMDQYRIQKLALEEAVQQLRFKYRSLQIQLVRPGYVPADRADQWAQTLIKLLESAHPFNIVELSLQ